MKKSFVLLEVLIGIALLGLFAAFFVHEPFRALKREVERLKEMEFSRVLEGKLWEMEKKLGRECATLPKTAFQDKKNGRTIQIPITLGQRSFLCEKKYELWCEHDKRDSINPDCHHYLVCMHLEGEPKDKPTYKFHVSVHKP